MATLSIISQLREQLQKQGNEKTRKSGQRFFKEEISLYGVKTASVHLLAKEFYQQIKNKNKEEIFSLCEDLLKTGIIEESIVASDWAYFLKKKYTPEDIQVFEYWIENYINNWATCDSLCNRAVGALLEKYPQLLPRLKVWAKSENMWLRRAAAVSLVVPARKGNYLHEILEIAEILLADKEDLVQKGYGWVLKEVSKQNLEEVFSFVMKHKASMPRTALRYAIEKMPAVLKSQAMAKQGI